jgi:hypothetical protein
MRPKTITSRVLEKDRGDDEPRELFCVGVGLVFTLPLLASSVAPVTILETDHAIAVA